MPQGLNFSAIQTVTYDFTAPDGTVYTLSDNIPFDLLVRVFMVQGRLADFQATASTGAMTAPTAQATMDAWCADVAALTLDVFHCTPAYAEMTSEELKATGFDTPMQIAIVTFFSSRLGDRYASMPSAIGNPTPSAATTTSN